jgi:hypothetical protein
MTFPRIRERHVSRQGCQRRDRTTALAVARISGRAAGFALIPARGPEDQAQMRPKASKPAPERDHDA